MDFLWGLLLLGGCCAPVVAVILLRKLSSETEDRNSPIEDEWQLGPTRDEVQRRDDLGQ